ncbi:unnamed protein product, partial [Meganyctiphanes norvegica]
DLPSSVTTTSNEAYISFSSDSFSTRSGFTLTWNTAGDLLDCGEHINQDSGSLWLPARRDSKYKNNVDCYWVIVSSEDTLELKFTSFSTERGKDYVYIRDGGSNSSCLLDYYSGDYFTMPPSVRTTTNKAFIHFTSDDAKTSTGFELTWDTA